MGKSRLAAEVVSHAGPGARVLFGRALPQGEQGTYVPFGQQVRAIAGILPEDSAAHARRRLHELVRHLGMTDVDAVVDHVSLMLGLRRDEGVPDRQPLFHSARTLLETAASQRTLILVFEDLHWADDSTLDLVEHLAARSRGVPLLIMVLARPELLDRRPSWAGGIGEHVAVTLRPLDEKESAALAAAMLDHDSDGSRALRVARRAEGNPLFVEELVAASSRGADGDLPLTVRSAIAARLDALPARSRALLVDCAVMGRRFWPAAVAEMRQGNAPPSPALTDDLEDLDAREIVRLDDLRDLPGQDQYLFRHILIREVAYDMLPVDARRERHAVVARFVERSSGERATEQAALLAHHWHEAGDRAETRKWSLLAAEQARRGWAKSEAIAALDAALDVTEPDDPERTEIRLQRCFALVENGQYAEAAGELDHVIPFLQGQDLLLALLARSKTAWWLEDAVGVRALTTRVQGEAALIGRPERSAPALALLSHVEGMEGRPQELITQGSRALDVWEPDRFVPERAYHMELVGLAQTWVGDYRSAERMLAQSFEAAESCHSVEAMIRAGASRGLALAGLGRHEEALHQLEAVVARGRELELVPRFTGRALNMMSMVLRELLDLDSAERCNDEALELGRHADFLLVQVQAGIDVLFIQLLRGDPSSARRRLPDLWEQTERAHGFHQWLMSGRLLVAEGEIAIAEQRWADALTAASRALDAARSTTRTKHEIAALRAHAAAHAAVGDRQDATATAQQAMDLAIVDAHPPTTWWTAAAAADIFAAADLHERAVQASDLARTTAHDFAASLSAHHRATFLSHPAVHRLTQHQG